MNSKIKIDKKMFITMISVSIVMLFGVIILNFIDSPKFYKSKEFDENESFEELYDPAQNPDFENTVFPININSATEDLLQLIPNIGPATAKLIIDYRNEQGTILDLEELMNIDGVGEKTVELLKEYCIII